MSVATEKLQLTIYSLSRSWFVNLNSGKPVIYVKLCLKFDSYNMTAVQNYK